MTDQTESETLLLAQARYVLKNLHAERPGCGYDKLAEACSRASAQCSQERLERAERALSRAGWTYTEGAEEWKPPLGPSASPLLDEIDHLREDCANLEYMKNAHEERIAELQYEAGMYKSLYENAIERCALVAEGFDAACNSPRMKLFEEAGLVIAVYKRDGEIGAAIRALSDTSTDRPTIPNILIDSRGNDIYTPEELGLSPRLDPAGKQARGKNGNGAWFGVIDSHNDPEHYDYRTVYAVSDSSPVRPDTRPLRNTGEK